MSFFRGVIAHRDGRQGGASSSSRTAEGCLRQGEGKKRGVGRPPASSLSCQLDRGLMLSKSLKMEGGRLGNGT